jgi:hypothetical protein
LAGWDEREEDSWRREGSEGLAGCSWEVKKTEIYKKYLYLIIL